MKLIIQIPCYNEEKTLGPTLQALPRKVEGFSSVELLIIDDGSTDRTVDIAKQHGVDHIVSHTKNMGLAKGFMTGLSACLKFGADVIVNTDADNQYLAEDIPKLVAPIVQGKADIVIGARPISSITHFSKLKKWLQKIGSWVVRCASNTDIPDAPSGFRAFSRQTAIQLNVFNDYTYTLETIIQAGQNNMAITSVDIRVNEETRPSRLVSSIPAYIKRSVITIVRIFATYQPFRFFMSIAVLLVALGLILGTRFLWFLGTGEGSGHIQSVILSGALLGMGVQIGLIAFVADLIGVNRKILEQIRLQINDTDKEDQ